MYTVNRVMREVRSEYWSVSHSGNNQTAIPVRYGFNSSKKTGIPALNNNIELAAQEAGSAAELAATRKWQVDEIFGLRGPV